MWQLWALSLALPAVVALGVYRLSIIGGARPQERLDARNGALLVFAALFALTAAHNLLDDGIEPDPYHDAQSPYEAAL